MSKKKVFRLDEEIKMAFEKSLELLKVAELTFNNEFYADSINRSYYAVFHAAKPFYLKRDIY